MKKNKNINIRINEEDAAKIEKVANYLQRTVCDTLRLAAMTIIEQEYTKILVKESNGITKKAVFMTEEE